MLIDGQAKPLTLRSLLVLSTEEHGRIRSTNLSSHSEPGHTRRTSLNFGRKKKQSNARIEINKASFLQPRAFDDSGSPGFWSRPTVEPCIFRTMSLTECGLFATAFVQSRPYVMEKSPRCRRWKTWDMWLNLYLASHLINRPPFSTTLQFSGRLSQSSLWIVLLDMSFSSSTRRRERDSGKAAE